MSCNIYKIMYDLKQSIHTCFELFDISHEKSFSCSQLNETVLETDNENSGST